MDRLWAPWRMEYIKTPKKPGCIFCEKSKSNRDKENLILYRGKEIFVLMNLYPYSNGHIMISPYKHTFDTNELSEICNLEIMKITNNSINILKTTLGADGFNFGVNVNVLPTLLAAISVPPDTL